jgi:hypothetical protein
MQLVGILGRDVWSLTLAEEHYLKVSENKVHNEELRNLYSSPNTVGVIK